MWIRYATNQSGSWQSFEIEQYVTGVSSIAIDSNDNALLSLQQSFGQQWELTLTASGH